jgi:hypothetical protein
MQSDAVSWHVRKGLIDGSDHELHELDKRRKRPILVSHVALQREVRCIDLEQEAMCDDGLVFDFKS